MKKLALVLLAVLSISVIALPGRAQALFEVKDNVCNGINPDSHDCTDNNKVTNIFKEVVNVLSLVVGALATVMVIVGGFKYVVSAGEANAVKTAKSTIMYALIGLIVALMTQGIVRFVFTKATTTPCTPDPARGITCP